MKYLRIMLLISAVILLGGCETVQIKEKINKDFVFLYGYIDMKGYTYGREMNALTIKQITPPTDDPYHGVEVIKGYFFNDELLPGIYCLSECGSENGSYVIPVDVGCLEIEKKGGIFYFGSYEIVKNTRKTASFKHVDKPNEAQVIAEMLKIVVKGSSVETSLIKRLKVLKEAQQRKTRIPHVE
jgi:hypothetical protein